MNDNQTGFSRILNKRFLINAVKIALLVLIVLIGNRLVQSYLGESAYEDTGLGDLTLAQALEIAKSTDRLVLADMSAVWCPSCRKLDKQVLSNGEVKQAINQSFVFTRIEYDSEQGQAFMQRYAVNGFPTLLVLNNQGDKLVQLPLTFDPNKFQDLLKRVTNQFK